MQLTDAAALSGVRRSAGELRWTWHLPQARLTRRPGVAAPPRARCEDRIRCAKDTGLRNLPLHGYAQNQIWCEIVALACEYSS
jgi:hypothetical protein